MTTKERLDERKFILECIKLYEKLPALWNTKDKDYSKREVKNKQYAILLHKYKQRYLNADKTDLVKKLNSLRTNFRKELKKINDSKVELSPEEPTLWYYDDMKFLLNIDSGCSQENSMSDGAVANELDPIAIDENEPKPKKKKVMSSTDELVRLATKRLNAPPHASQQLATVWGVKLSKMERNQRIIAEKVINEVMFYAELGLLNFNTSLKNINAAKNIIPSSSVNSNAVTLISMKESLDIPATSTYTLNYGSTQTPNNATRQGFSADCVNYQSNSPPLVNSAVTSDQENEPAEENFIISEFVPLNNSVKIED